MIKRSQRPLAPLLAVILTVTSFAHEVTLKNGDRITGKVVERNDETVTVETEYAGIVKIKAEHIKEIAEEADVAEAPKRDEARSVAAVEPKPAAVVPAPKPTPRLFGGRFMGIAEGWEGNASFGYSFSSGNTRTSTLTTGMRAVKTGGIDKLTVYARSLWHNNRNNSAQSTTQNAVWGGARYDRNLTQKVFGFVSYDFERDRPKKLNFRSVAGGGMGYRPIRNERTELDLLLGGAWNRTWQVGPNTDTPEGLAGLSFKHRFHRRLRVQNAVSFFQNVTDKNEYRVIFDATLTADLTKKIGWHITLGDRFNNDPVGNSKRNDVFVTTGLRWTFGAKK